MNNDSVLIGFVLLAIIYCICKNNQNKQNNKKEPFSPYESFFKNSLEQEDSDKDKLLCLGYDNPYIYPYNYSTNQSNSINQNNSIDRFKNPGWVRQMELDSEDSDNLNFPGFNY